MSNPVGRPSKILIWGLTDRVNSYIASGKSDEDISGILRGEGFNVSHTAINRWRRNLTKKKVTIESSSEVIEEFDRMFSDIYFHLTKLDMNGNDKKAMRDYLRERQRAFRYKLKQYYEPETRESEHEVINRWIVDWSNCICPSCRKNIMKVYYDYFPDERP